MIQPLLPPGAVSAESDGAGPAPEILAAEAHLVAGAAAGRRRDFAFGRACAREALAGLGWSDYAVVAGPGRQPRWPPGTVGSITHCTGYCAAAVARSGDLLGLGIDAEPNVAVTSRWHRRVGVDTELLRAGRVPDVDPALLVFSAKEAFYKAWYPLTGHELGLLDGTVHVDNSQVVGGHGCFDVRLVAPSAVALLPPDATVEGQWAVTPSHVFTVAAIRRATIRRHSGEVPVESQRYPGGDMPPDRAGGLH